MESLAIDYTVDGGVNWAERRELIIYSWDRGAQPVRLFQTVKRPGCILSKRAISPASCARRAPLRLDPLFAAPHYEEGRMQPVVDPRPTSQEFHEGWDFLFYITRESEGGRFVGIAEIQKQGQLHCKVLSVHPESSGQFAIDHLRELCQVWVADWVTRSHSGDTDAMPLV